MAGKTCLLWRFGGTRRWDISPPRSSVAALGDGRFHWSRVPLWLVVVGYVLLTISWCLFMWVESVNKFAEPGVRVHAEQRVIDTGPYAIVRHPLRIDLSKSERPLA